MIRRSKVWASIFLIGSTYFGFAAFADDKQTVVVAMVPKTNSSPHYVRLVSEHSDLIVTNIRPQDAEETLAVTLTDDERLYIVELQQKNDFELPHELGRFGRFAVVRTTGLVHQHAHFGRVENFVKEVDLRALIQPPPRRVRKFEPVFSQKSHELVIDKGFLEQSLQQFSGAVPTEIGGEQTTISERGSKQGRKLAVEWLKQQYRDLGFEVREHNYRSGTNFIAERGGADTTKTYIMSAHLDSMSNAGADDDGSGTISALAIAKALQPYELRYNLRVLGFDQEEDGLVGSREYVQHLRANDELGSILGVFNLEMTGYDADADGAVHIIDCNENTSSRLTSLITQAIEEQNIELEKSPACTNRSDHAAFWRYDVPAIVVSQNFFGGDSNPCYHRSCDRVDKIHWDYMLRVSTAVAHGLAKAIVVDQNQ